MEWCSKSIADLGMGIAELHLMHFTFSNPQSEIRNSQSIEFQHSDHHTFKILR